MSERIRPRLQRELGIVSFFRSHRGFPILSEALMGRMTAAFVDEIETFVNDRDCH